MHHISELRIEGFKSILNAVFPLTQYTPLVGYNNAGKTNILRAACWVVKKSSLSADDFNDTECPVIVEAEISGISEEVLSNLDEAHRKRIEPLISDERIRIRRIQDKPGQAVGTIGIEVWKESANGEMEWVSNPTGIDAAIGGLFPDPIFIGAMENATEDVAKFGSGTTIGKLLKEIMTPVIARHSPRVAEALQDVGRQLTANSEDKDATLSELDTAIQGELDALFPGVSAKIHVPVPDFADFMKSATLRIFEQGYEHAEGRDASSFGHGAQRSIQIALIKCLAEAKRNAEGNASRTTLLLIDEPELYLHPQAVEIIRAALSRLAGRGYQIIITTHSANMIARSDAQNVLLIHRNSTNGTTSRTRIKDAVARAIEEADHQSEVLFALTNSTKVLFSEHVVIAEGKTEQNILPALFENHFGLTLGEAKIGLIDIGGVGNVPDTMHILSTMGLPRKAIVDLDFAFREAPKKGLIDDDNTALLSCKAFLSRLESEGKISLDQSGLPKSHNGDPASKAFELLASERDAAPHIDALFEAMQRQDIWLWKKGAIEAYLGIAKTSSARMTLIDRISDSTYRESLPDYGSIVDALNWLRN